MTYPIIYVIDDDKVLLEFIKDVLERKGYCAQIYEKAEDCLESLNEGSPDLVIADHSLPGMDGCSLLEYMKKQCPKAWRILITGKQVDDRLVRDAVNRAGVHHFIQKPFGVEEFLFAVEKALEDQRQYAQLQELLNELEDLARKKAKEALSFQRRYKSLFEKLHLGVFVTKWDGEIVELNPFGRWLFGLKKENEIRISIKDLFPTELIFSNIQRLLKEKGEVRGLETVLIQSGDREKEIPISITAFLLEDPDLGRLILGIIEDLTKDVELKARLFEAQLQLRSTIDAMKDLIFTVNRDHEIISWNKAIVDFLGEDFTDLKGKKCFEVFGGINGLCCVKDNLEGSVCPYFQKVFDLGQEERRTFCVSKEKDIYWEHWIYPICDISGNVMQAVIVFRDVSEDFKKNLEIERMNKELARLYDEAKKKNQEFEKLIKELKEAQAHLVQSGKLASIGQLSAGIAHEINNPVGFISSNLNTLKDYAADLEEFFRKVIEIVESVQEKMW